MCRSCQQCEINIFFSYLVFHANALKNYCNAINSTLTRRWNWGDNPQNELKFSIFCILLIIISYNVWLSLHLSIMKMGLRMEFLLEFNFMRRIDLEMIIKNDNSVEFIFIIFIRGWNKLTDKELRIKKSLNWHQKSKL